MPSDLRRVLVLSVAVVGLVRLAAATETSAIRTVATFACDRGPSQLTAVGAEGYFVADDGVRGSELWRTRGKGR